MGKYVKPTTEEETAAAIISGETRAAATTTTSWTADQLAPTQVVGRAPKSERLQLLVYKWTRDQLKQTAAVLGVSVNELANEIFLDYFKNDRWKEFDKWE